MAIVEIRREPTTRDLRWFGGLLFLFIALAGAVSIWRFDSPGAARAIWSVGFTMMLVYAAAPRSRKWIYLGWTYAVFPIGWTISHVLLAGIYYLVLTPTGIALRLVKGDPLERAVDRTAPTYWKRRHPVSNVEDYFRQF